MNKTEKISYQKILEFQKLFLSQKENVITKPQFLNDPIFQEEIKNFFKFTLKGKNPNQIYVILLNECRKYAELYKLILREFENADGYLVKKYLEFLMLDLKDEDIKKEFLKLLKDRNLTLKEKEEYMTHIFMRGNNLLKDNNLEI